MSPPTETLSDVLASALALDLELERRLIRAYHSHVQTAASPRLRQVFDQGLAVKRRHEVGLVRLTGAAAGGPALDEGTRAPLPGPREILPWYFDRERALALRYRDQAALTEAPDIRRTLEQMAEAQTRQLAAIKTLYRDFSSS